MDDLFHLCPKFPFGAGVTAEQGWGRDSGVAGAGRAGYVGAGGRARYGGARGRAGAA